MINKNNLDTVDAVDEVARMCKNYTKQMAYDLPLYMCGSCGMRQFVKPKVTSDQRYYGYRYINLKDLDPLLKFDVQQQQNMIAVMISQKNFRLFMHPCI